MKTKILSLFGKRNGLQYLFLSLLLIGISSVQNMGVSLIVKDITSYFTDGVDLNFGHLIFIFVAVMGAVILIIPFLTGSVRKSKAIAISGLNDKVTKKMLSLPMSFFDRNASGELISYLNQNVKSSGEALSYFSTLISNLCALFLYAFYLMYLNWLFGAITLGLSLMFCLINFIFIKPLKVRSGSMWSKISYMYKEGMENVNGYESIKAADADAYFIRKYKKTVDRYCTDYMQIIRQYCKLSCANAVASYGCNLILSLIGCYFIYIGKLDSGTLLATLLVCGTVLNYMLKTAEIPAKLQVSAVGTEKLTELLRMEEEKERVFTNAKSDKEELAMQHVFFSYDKAPVLSDVSMSVKRGESVAIVGPNGGGKSTILKLLLGLYQPEKGKIEIFSQNSIEGDVWSIAYIPQEPYIFRTSIRENIRMGNTDATDAEIIEAAQKARAHDFIMRLPDQYDTILYGQNDKLSRGERQRIQIARAILKRPVFVFMDEAVASVDHESKTIIHDTIKKEFSDCGVISVTHDAEELDYYDTIYKLECGKLNKITVR